MEALKHADMPEIAPILTKTQQCWEGHVVRMDDGHDDSNIPQLIFYGQLAMHKRKPGGKQLRYKHTLQKT